MIPTLVFYGLVAGRWWIVAAAAVGWPILLVYSDAMTLEPGLAGGALLAAVNAAVGVMLHKAVATLGRVVFRLVDPRSRPRADQPAS